MNEHRWEKHLIRTIGLLITIIMTFIAWESSKWSASIDALSINVAQLDTKMEAVVSQLGNGFNAINEKLNKHDTELEDHEARMRVIETLKVKK